MLTKDESKMATLEETARDNAQAILDMKSREAGMLRKGAKE